MTAQHFISVSGGKDSQAVICLAIERLHKRGLDSFGGRPPRFMSADTGHENPLTIAHIAYLDEELRRRIGIGIETVSGYDVPGLIDAAAFERQREIIRVEWAKEKRRTSHDPACKVRQRAIPKLAPGCRASPERAAALRLWVADCRCPVRVSPPIPDDLIEAAVAALIPTGIAFLDMAMLHGRFPSTGQRFCTEELKVLPMFFHKEPLLDEGIDLVEWIGERSDESKAREAKGWLTMIRHERARQALYRPIYWWDALRTFRIAERHGLRSNPLYRMGAGRVGCSPCIMTKKDELDQWAWRFPEEVERVRNWERIVGRVSRRLAGLDRPTSFMSAPTVPGTADDRALIDRVVTWARTGRGGRNYDLERFLERADADAGQGPACASVYRLCE